MTMTRFVPHNRYGNCDNGNPTIVFVCRAQLSKDLFISNTGVNLLLLIDEVTKISNVLKQRWAAFIRVKY